MATFYFTILADLLINIIHTAACLNEILIYNLIDPDKYLIILYNIYYNRKGMHNSNLFKMDITMIFSIEKYYYDLS